MAKTIQIEERYHDFQRGDEICRYGIYGLSRQYIKGRQQVAASEPHPITLTIPEPKLKVMQAVITSKCNLKCTYCSFEANAPELPVSEMDQKELAGLCDTFNDQIGEKGLLLITGGEPEMYNKAVDYLVKNITGKIIIFTNGTVTDRSRLQFYLGNNVGVLFSLDGDLFAQNSVRRLKNGSYNKVAAALHLAKEVGLDYGISAVVGDHNIEKLPQLVESICQEFQPASIGLNLPHRYGDTAWMRIEEYTDAIIEIFSYAKKIGLFVDQINRRLSPLITRKFRFRDCSAQGEKIVAFPGGIQTACVNQAGLNESVDWSERLPILSDQCKDCYAIAICGGGCIFDGEAIYGHGRFDERNCYFTKKMLEHMIWDFRDELGDNTNDDAALTQKYESLLNRAEGTHLSVGHETV